MLCPPASACGCAFQSSTLNITVDADGTWHIEQAQFTDIAAMQADIAALKAWQTTATGQISALETSSGTHAAAITRFDAMAASNVLQSGLGVGPTVTTTPLVIASATIGPFNTAGTVVWGGHAVYTKTVATDTFSGFARHDGTSRGRGTDFTQLLSGWVSATTARALAATDAPVIDFALARNGGTGTATTLSVSVAGGLFWMFIPN